MNASINGALLLVLVCTYGGLLCLRYSPELLERIAIRMRARARALVASRETFATVYAESLRDDARINQERAEMRAAFEEVARERE